MRLCGRYLPEWILWENVPGCLSIGGGRGFAAFLHGLGELGYKCAWRVLNAQFFGVPQRRRRVFLVGNLRDWRNSTAVLFERESLRRDFTPSYNTGETSNVAGTLSARTEGGGGFGTDLELTGGLQVVAGTLTPGAHPGGFNGQDAYSNLLIPTTTGTLTARYGGCAMGAPEVDANLYLPVAKTLLSKHNHAASDGSDSTLLPIGLEVRRLTPMECERLQGFPDNYTNIEINGKYCGDSARYKALGNSMAVPVLKWLGERILAVDRATR
jgi:DNA (cytosine-5)-methyltransferase 1